MGTAALVARPRSYEGARSATKSGASPRAEQAAALPIVPNHCESPVAIPVRTPRTQIEISADPRLRHKSQKNELKPWLKEQYCLPEEPSGEFVYHMEDVLEVYTRPYDPRRPQVCLDETSVQLIGEKRIPVPMAPGRLARFDYEYERNGVCALFMLNEPLRGWREVVVADQRTAIDFAHVIKHLVDVHYPDAEQDRAGDGQPEHAHTRFAVRSVRANRSEATGGQVGDPLHAQARQLARHGRDRAECVEQPMLGPAHPRQSTRWSAKSLPGCTTATSSSPPSTGASPPPMPASNSSASTRRSCHDGPLVPLPVD